MTTKTRKLLDLTRAFISRGASRRDREKGRRMIYQKSLIPKSHAVSIKSGLCLPSNLTRSIEETLIRLSVNKLHQNWHLPSAIENCTKSAFVKTQQDYACEKERWGRSLICWLETHRAINTKNHRLVLSSIRLLMSFIMFVSARKKWIY